MFVARLGLVLTLLATSACVSVSSDNYVLPIRGDVTAVPSAEGVALATDGPSRVHAAMSGTVIKVERASDGSRTLVMDHGGGMRTEYAQLSRVTASRGEELRRGHTIGWIGRRGANEAELHFAMRVGEASVDPTKVVDMSRATVAVTADKYGPLASAR